MPALAFLSLVYTLYGCWEVLPDGIESLEQVYEKEVHELNAMGVLTLEQQVLSLLAAPMSTSVALSRDLKNVYDGKVKPASSFLTFTLRVLCILGPPLCTVFALLVGCVRFFSHFRMGSFAGGVLSGLGVEMSLHCCVLICRELYRLTVSACGTFLVRIFLQAGREVALRRSQEQRVYLKVFRWFDNQLQARISHKSQMRIFTEKLQTFWNLLDELPLQSLRIAAPSKYWTAVLLALQHLAPMLVITAALFWQWYVNHRDLLLIVLLLLICLVKYEAEWQQAKMAKTYWQDSSLRRLVHLLPGSIMQPRESKMLGVFVSTLRHTQQVKQSAVRVFSFPCQMLKG